MSSTHISRVLAGVLEPVTGQVYFSPECHSNYQKLGFGASPRELNGVMAPDGPAYFTSRGSVMGQVPGHVVAATFAVFKPEVVLPSVAYGWTLTDATTICAARDDGAIGQLHRIIGENPEGAPRARTLLSRATAVLRPEGRALFAGMSSLAMPGSVVGDVWRLGDMLREYRGDSHTAAWISAGFTACEIGVLSELFWGMPIKSYSRSRGWDEADYDEAIERLLRDGLITDDGTLATQGRAQRELVEQNTDKQMECVVRALGSDIDELIAILKPWGALIREKKGYPAAGPHDLADAAN